MPEAIPEPFRRSMEAAFGADFSDVRIHNNSLVPGKLGARAATIGSEIHLAPGAFHAESPGGRQLLAHELAHVVQQRSRSVAPTHNVGGLAVNDDGRLAAEAAEMATKALAGSRVNVVAPGGSGGAPVAQFTR